MKLSQKKNCNGCKAMLGVGTHDFLCTLGFKVRAEAVGTTYIPYYNLFPEEPCYKPKTYQQLIDAKLEIEKARRRP